MLNQATWFPVAAWMRCPTGDQLLAPGRVVLAAAGRPNDENVQVAGRVTVASGRRSEQRRVLRGHRPARDLLPQELEHPGAQLHEFDDGRGSKVLAVEPAQLRRPLLLGQDEPMLGEPEDHLVGPVMRHASDPGDLPDGERRIRPRQCPQHRGGPRW
jgi:hypothetical protein